MSMEYESDSRGGYDDTRDTYDRDRSGSPRPRSANGNSRMRSRSASPGGRGDSGGRPSASESADRRDRDPSPGGGGKEDQARNTGTNLFVTGIHPKLSEEDVAKIFGKYGEVVKCNIMLDPHTKESRGFGFVNFATSDQADAAKDGLQGENYEGRTLSIEKARRNRPRTPTPGKYFGPPKRDDFRRGPPGYGGGGGGRSSYRGGGGGGYGGRYGDRYEDDRYYRSRYDDRDRDRERDRDRHYSRRDYGGRDDYDRGGRDDRREPAGFADDRAPADAPPRDRGERGGYHGDRDRDRGDRGDREDRSYRR